MTCLAFDVDGTLFDCSDIIVDAFQKGISLFIESSKKNVLMPSKERIISVLGIPTDTIFRNLFPELNEPDQFKLNELCVNVLSDMISTGEGSIYDHVHSTLEKLYNEGYKIYAASNGKLNYIRAILESKDLSRFFTYPIITLNSDIKSKSDIVKHYKTGMCADELLIMIGDRASDRIAAEDNNIPFIGCAFGHAGLSELQGVQWTTTDFAMIYNIVKDIEKNYKK